MNNFTKKIVITTEDVENYAKMTGDFNPIHFDEVFASTTIFKRPIVHGPILLTKITSFFANEFPGPGTIYLSHEYKFLKPIYINEIIKVELRLISQNEKYHLFVSTKCFNENEDCVFDGTARLKKIN
jgi:3-hydroxybutyryl-CoA dehydratase